MIGRAHMEGGEQDKDRDGDEANVVYDVTGPRRGDSSESPQTFRFSVINPFPTKPACRVTLLPAGALSGNLHISDGSVSRLTILGKVFEFKWGLSI